MVENSLIVQYLKNSSAEGMDKINRELLDKTGSGIVFEDMDELERAISGWEDAIVLGDVVEHGDYQTPSWFCDVVCDYLVNDYGVQPEVIIEPTFGKGNFITSSVRKFSRLEKVLGVELQSGYCSYAKINVLNACAFQENKGFNVFLKNEDAFGYDFSGFIQANSGKEIVVIGNPPWVTNAQLSALRSSNIPEKRNFKNHKGLDAITGKGNFDVAEYIILKMLDAFNGQPGTLAMLCKNVVARNILRDIHNYGFTVSDVRLVGFDAKKVFDVAAEASLLVMKVNSVNKEERCSVYDFGDVTNEIKKFGWVNGSFVSNIAGYNFGKAVDGLCPMTWRQGVKHDASKVMELKIVGEALINGNQEVVSIEDTYVYHLLKSSGLKNKITQSSKKKVIITQKKVNQETASIKRHAPKLWHYLNEHSEKLDGRKSSIYRKAPRFAIFGIGEYAFKPYKVAISGFYKSPNFSLIVPMSNKPVMLDDTCYFIGFDNYVDALLTMILLNSGVTQTFLTSIAFLDNKRPYTKDILMRIDLNKVAEHYTIQEINEMNKTFLGDEADVIPAETFETYKEKLKNVAKKQLRFAL